MHLSVAICAKKHAGLNFFFSGSQIGGLRNRELFPALVDVVKFKGGQAFAVLAI